MITLRKIPTLGIGFGVRAFAVIGLLPDEVIGDQPCGTICCSIITGHFGLGCSPIISKFDLNYGCSPIEPPIEPPPQVIGGGGGSIVSVKGFFVPFIQKTSECNRTVYATVKFTTDKVWRRMYAVNTCNNYKFAMVDHLVNNTNKPTIDVNHIKQSERSVVITLLNTDK